MSIRILKASEINEEVQIRITDLYRQLNPDNKQRTLTEIVTPQNNVLVLICQIDHKIVGIALLSTYKVISGYRGMVDDVVVDINQRGKGIGRKLMIRLIEESEKMKLDEILLFTGHHRAPAKALYESLGFKLRDSGLYNLQLN